MNAPSRPRATDPIEASLAQPCLTQHRTASGRVACAVTRVATLTLGAPVCAPEHLLEVARDFTEARPSAAFFYLQSAHVQALRELRLNAVPIGEDFIIDLPARGWSESVRSAARKATKAGLTLVELSADDLVDHEPAMRTIQAAYLAKQEVTHELRFLTRPCEFSAERVGRTFGLFQRGSMLGFIVVDPYTTEAGGIGALLNLFRIGPTKLWSVYSAVVKLLAERLEAEGASELSLGFVPLSFTEKPKSWQLALLRAVARSSPYLRGLRAIKESLPAWRSTRWLLTPRMLLARDLVALFLAMGVYGQGGH